MPAGVLFDSMIRRMGLIRPFAWALAATGSLVCVFVVLLYLHQAPPLLIRLVNRPACEPTEEEYAVYSDFIDSLFSSDQPFRTDEQIGPDSLLYIIDETAPLRSFHRLPPVPPLLGVDAFGPDQDFYQQNARPWHLKPSFHPRMKWALAPAGATNRAGEFRDAAVRGVLQLSRVGLDWRRHTGTLSYTYRCGMSCGQSGEGVLLQKVGEHWHVRTWGWAVVY